MAYAFYISAGLLFTISFACAAKKMHLFERFMVWATVIFVNENIITLLSLNYKVLQLPKQFIPIAVYFFSRIVITPLIVVWFFDIVESVGRMWSKLLVFIMTMALLVGTDYLFRYMKILKYTSLMFWWVAAKWLLILLVAFWVKRWYRGVLQREVKT